MLLLKILKTVLFVFIFKEQYLRFLLQAKFLAESNIDNKYYLKVKIQIKLWKYFIFTIWKE